MLRLRGRHIKRSRSRHMLVIVGFRVFGGPRETGCLLRLLGDIIQRFCACRKVRAMAKGGLGTVGVRFVFIYNCRSGGRWQLLLVAIYRVRVSDRVSGVGWSGCREREIQSN